VAKKLNDHTYFILYMVENLYTIAYIMKVVPRPDETPACRHLRYVEDDNQWKEGDKAKIR
jgi:hypothetical protein